ncbi:putative oxidoreductase [Diplodia seriata]|uniref:Putative oxidoreductase n=1 Tax=Diplodia seriata TaxID=420778 RepID=A0A0G2DU30_9PEZI|nr:putative oxidoreductase [Diplodia seriata]
MAISLALPWSPGERAMQTLLHTPPDTDNPTSSFMTPQAATMLARAPTIALGALDADGRPWATVWGGEPGFAQPLGNGIFGVRAPVDRRFDPVAQALADGKAEGEVLVVKVEQSLGNCPKYLNSKTIHPATPHPVLLSSSPTLTPTARALIAKADLFFISSANATTHDMDVNHRGGPAGFVRILPSSDPSSPTTLVYPEYSGNRLYQTLGNLHTTPLAGLCFPDFATGDVLYATGTARIHAGKAAAALLPRSTLAVAVTLTAARLVRRGLPFRGTPAAAGAGNAAAAAAVVKTGTDEDKTLGMSPYNPPVRLLAAEGNLLSSTGKQAQQQEQELTATLRSRDAITPGPASSIARFTFALSAPAAVARGQWVALDASEELDAGYSHMRDDDPASLNDDFVRTFTVTWADGWEGADHAHGDGDEGVVVRPSTQFAITVRRHGPVTGLLFTTSERAPGLVLAVRGFGGGEFRLEEYFE